MRTPSRPRKPRRTLPRTAPPVAPEERDAARTHPGFDERDDPPPNEPVEHPEPPDARGEHDYGSVAPDALEGPATVER